MKNIDDIKIYQRYLEIKAVKGKVNAIFKEYGISRQTLYDAIRRVQNGDGAALKRCLTASKFECLWEYKYQARFLSLPTNRKVSTINEFRSIISDMKKDGFPASLIADKLKKERSTIFYHLANTTGGY